MEKETRLSSAFRNEQGVLLKPALHLKDRSQYNCFIGLRLSEIYMGSCPGATRMHVLLMSSKNCFRVKYRGRYNEDLPISATKKGYIDNSILKIKSYSNATINVIVIISIIISTNKNGKNISSHLL